MKFNTWLDTFLKEKDIDLDMVITVKSDGPFGDNIMPLSVLIDQLKKASASDKRAIKNSLVKLDFVNAPIVPFFAHIAKAIAI